MKEELELLQQLLTKKREKNVTIPKEDFISTGLTTLNLGSTGDPDIGIPKGRFVYIVGDSSTGKTWIAAQIAAELANNKRFDHYKIIGDWAEGGALMNVRKYFGQRLYKRLRAPKGTRDDPQYSRTLEEFFDNANDTVDAGPCLYILDSMDSLVPKDEEKYAKKERQAREKGQEVSGTYGTNKAKINSAKLRILDNKIRKNGSILIIISQTRQNIGFTARYEPKTRSGGDALHFYNRLEIWLSLIKKDWKKVGTKRIKLGQITKAKIVKNHLTGWEGEVEIPIYKDVGVDDTGACVDYLVNWGYWKETKGRIRADDFGVKMFREPLCQHIEDNDRKDKLRKLVAKHWNDIESKHKIKRRKRYE
jgi:RecA/RadA recombinase